MALRRVVISGCSGGGKSSLIGGLTSQGFPTVAEAGRILVRQELDTGGQALPWIDPKLFAERLADLTLDQFHSVSELYGLVFFDRCIIEPLVYSQMNEIDLSDKVRRSANDWRYENPIFIVPPWEEIYVHDEERKHSFQDAVAEYEALHKAFLDFNYEVCIIPKMTIENRINFILAKLNT
jgi:predicted ATPase